MCFFLTQYPSAFVSSPFLCFIVQKTPSKMTFDIYVNTVLFWLCAFQSIYFTSFKRHQGKKTTCMLAQVSTVRSCRMAVQAASGELTQLLWGMHSNTFFYCVILYAQAMWQLAFSGAYKGTAEGEKSCLSLRVCSLSCKLDVGLTVCSFL